MWETFATVSTNSRQPNMSAKCWPRRAGISLGEDDVRRLESERERALRAFGGVLKVVGHDNLMGASPSRRKRLPNERTGTERIATRRPHRPTY
jgi:hypothetical protein